jgi:hypothetical protein
VEWILYHVVYKLYWEGVHDYGKGLYQYADIIRLVPSLTPDQFRRFARLAARFNMEVGVHFVLRRLQSDFRLETSPEIAVFIERVAAAPRGRSPRQDNDLGDMWPKLWGYR